MADRQPARRRLPDPLALLAGLGALVVAVTGLVGGTTWLPPVDLRWLVAAVAVTVGVLLIATSLRRRS